VASAAVAAGLPSALIPTSAWAVAETWPSPLKSNRDQVASEGHF
jgi:hypothetical protein